MLRKVFVWLQGDMGPFIVLTISYELAQTSQILENFHALSQRNNFPNLTSILSTFSVCVVMNISISISCKDAHVVAREPLFVRISTYEQFTIHFKHFTRLFCPRAASNFVWTFIKLLASTFENKDLLQNKKKLLIASRITSIVLVNDVLNTWE